MQLLVRPHEQGLDSLLPAEFDDRLRVPLGVSFRDDDAKVTSVKSCRERAHICGESPVTLRLASDRVRELYTLYDTLRDHCTRRGNKDCSAAQLPGRGLALPFSVLPLHGLLVASTVRLD